jgi:hypothetical protein
LGNGRPADCKSAAFGIVGSNPITPTSFVFFLLFPFLKGFVMASGNVKRRWFVAEAETGYIMDGTSERGYGCKEIAAEFRSEVDDANRRQGKFTPAELVYGYAEDA